MVSTRETRGSSRRQTGARNWPYNMCVTFDVYVYLCLYVHVKLLNRSCGKLPRSASASAFVVNWNQRMVDGAVASTFRRQLLAVDVVIAGMFWSGPGPVLLFFRSGFSPLVQVLFFAVRSGTGLKQKSGPSPDFIFSGLGFPLWSRFRFFQSGMDQV